VFSDRARSNYDGLTPFATYLRTIMKNLVIDDFRRKERALVEYSVDDDGVELPEAHEAPEPSAGRDPFAGRAEPTGQPDADQGHAELLELVHRFKTGLGARERRVYELRFEQELEHEQISDRTGLSPSKIKTSEQRIRTGFFRFMHRHGYFQGYRQERRGWLQLLRSF